MACRIEVLNSYEKEKVYLICVGDKRTKNLKKMGP
jgi:hypothetical protein